MPSLQEILRDPNYINANEATKRAIFERHAPLDQNYTGANDATQAAIRQRFGIGEMFAPVAPPPPEKQSAFRQVADVPLGIAKGAVQGVRMIADAFGAGSDTSNTIKSAENYLADLMSAQAKNDQQEISRIMKDAEDKGVLDQVKAAVKAFTVAPVDTLSSALGTAAPVIVGALGAKVLGAGALLTTGVSALTGAGMGAGVVKGSIYEETKRTLKAAGASEEEAERRAQLAQQYNGKNLDQILLGTVLGGAAAVGPLEKGAAGILARRILGKTGTEGAETVAEQTAKGALRRRAEAGLLEAVPEAVQAGQEKVAENIALQREGFDVPTFRGAAGAATLEAIAGGGLGATLGGGKPEAPAPVAPPVAPPPVAPPVAPPAPAPEAGLEQLTPQQKQELERQRALTQRPKTTEELLAETSIQTGRPTTAQDIFRIRDEHETAVIEGLLAQDAEMARANELARRQLELESEAEATAGGISDVDARVREGRIFARVQDLIDRNIPYASTAINDINQKFGVINEAPLTEEERARVENIMGMVNTFTNFVNLPVLAPKPVDQFAENQAMEALIKERTESGQAQPLRTTPPAPSPRIEEAPVSQGVGEGAAVRPTGGVEPSVAQDRQLVTPAPAVPAAPAAEETTGPKTGDFVKLTVPGVGGPIGRAGKVEQILPNGNVEIRTQQGEIVTKPAGEVTVVTPAATKAEAPAPETPASETQAEPLGTRKEAQAFGKAIGATQPYPGELRGRVNLPAQKAAKEGNFQGVLSALEKSKNVIVAEIAKRARALGTKIVIDDDAEETYTGPSTLMRQMSIDGAKMHLEALNKIRELAPQVDALPDKAELSYAIRGETINAIDGGESAGRMYLEDIAKMGHSMFAPLPIGEGKFRTKEDFKRLQKAYEDLTSEYGENALQLTSTGSAQMTGVAGVYDANTDTIRVPEYTAKREEVLSHEIVHAQTVQAIASPTLRQKPIVARLNKLYEHVKKELEVRPGFSNSLRRAPYGIQSIQEFVAEGMGNPAFQFLLKKIKYENTSAWDSFVQTIANLIGVKRDTAFTELLAIYSELTTEQKAEPKAPAVKAPAPKAEAPAVEAPAAPPTLDTTGIKEVKGRHIQVQAAAKLLQDKKMTREEFEKYVDYYKPIQEVEADKLLPPTTEQRMNETVNADKRDRINVPVEDGTKVGLRMDLPARERGGSVVSIHEGKSGKLTVGKLMGFRSTGWLKDVTFEVRSQEKGLAVATGAAKAPQQTVEGTWQNLGPEETYARVKELMKDPAWKQIGFDPSRHGYFYDRKTREPVVSASEMYQVGQFLLAKDVQYAPKENYLYSVEPTIKSDSPPSFKRGASNLRRRWGEGEITSDEFANRASVIAKQVETAELSSKLTPNQRGAKYISQRLQEAKQKGELTKDAVDFAEWFILKNPKLVDDLAVSIESTNESGLGGTYQVIERLMTLIKNGQSDYAIVHEMLHHLERMMPEDVRSAITKSWFKALVEAEKNAKTDAEAQFIKNIMDYHLGAGGRSALIKAVDSLKNGSVGISFYQYVDPSEFWAENGSKIMGNRFLMKGSVLKKLKQWLREFAEKAKDLFGLNSKAPIIRALDSLSKGDGKFVTDRMIYQGVEPKRNILQQAGEKTTPKDKATENFLRWFGDSKVVDRNGEPLVVYHGTKADISAFDMSRSKDAGVWFTPVAGAANVYAGQEAGSNIIPAYVSLRDPYETKIGESRLDALMNAMDKGHDGIIVRDAKGNISTLAVFEPTQIKSAIGNNGDYSLTNPDIRKSIGGVSPGQKALETIRSMGMDVKPPEPGTFKKIKKALTDAGENPAGTKESAKKALIKFGDWFETTVFSGDAAWSNTIHRSVIKDMKENEEVLGKLLEIRQSQTVNADNVVSRGLIEGTIEYDDETKKHQSVKKEENFAALHKKLEEIAKKYDLTKEQMERIAHTYLVAKRLPGIIKRNEELDAEIKAEEATAKPDRKSIDKWKSLKVFVSPQQEAMVEPGLSLLKDIPELSQIPKMINEIRKNHIKFMVDSGLWSAEYAQAMWDNIDWVPFYREEQLEADAGPQEVIRGLQVKSKEFQMKGSEAAVNDVFENMMLWSQYAMNRGIRADKARRMIDVAKDIDVGDRKMAVQVTEEKRGMNIVRIYRDGKQELWDVADPMFMDAFASIQNVSMPMFKWAAKMADILRNSVVLYPLFSVAQVPQDSFAAMYTSGLKPQYTLRIPILAVKEFIKTLNKTSATHNQLVKYGVVGARTFNAEVMRKDAEIFAGMKPPKGGWNKTKDFLEHIAMSADNAVRQAVYEAARQQGVSKAEALEKAFEIFNVRRRGTSKALNLAGQTIPFFYAYLAAQRVAYQTITGAGTSPTERKAALQTLAATSAAVFTLSLLYAMLVADDEDYADTPAPVRDRTLTIPGTGGVRIPLRPDFFLFPKIIAEHTYLMLTDQGYQDGAKFRRSMRDGLVNAIASPTPLPQIAKPALEVAINYSFFDGKPVIGTFEKQKDLERQFNDSTSEFSKLIGQTGLVSPIAVDHLIRGMLGSAGGLALYGTNFVLHSDPDVPRPELSWKEAAAALPGTSGFLKRPQESALKNDFYTLRDEVEKAVNTFNDIKTRSPEGIEAFLADEKQMARLMLGKPVDKINRELSKIRRQITIITNMPESQMSAEDKADYKRQLMELEREILRSVNVKELREMAKI